MTENPIVFIVLLQQPVLSITIPTVTAPAIPKKSKISPIIASSVGEYLNGVKMFDMRVPTACIAPKGRAYAMTSIKKFLFQNIALKADLKSKGSYQTDATAEGGVFGFSRINRLKIIHTMTTIIAYTIIRLLKFSKNCSLSQSLTLNQYATIP